MPDTCHSNLFGCAQSLMEGSGGLRHMATRPSEALLLTHGEVPGPGAPGGSDVRRSGGCREVPVSRMAGQEDELGQESLCGMKQFVFDLSALPNGCWRGDSLWPGCQGLPPFPGFLPPAVP